MTHKHYHARLSGALGQLLVFRIFLSPAVMMVAMMVAVMRYASKRRASDHRKQQNGDEFLHAKNLA